ncbi:MAG: formyltransferase family protein, partial [Nitrospinota bacterium]|nr:formyltransferase family protein [Nitrospinota bacterium]
MITGNQWTHKYFLNQLGSQFELSAVFIENFQYPNPSFNSDEERKTWNEFFLIRHKTEKSLLQVNENSFFKENPKIFNIEKGFLNSDKTLQLIQKLNPSKIIIFGTSLLNLKYLKLYPNRILNLHVGLSQYYRGSSCNFWPIYDLKPQFLGATVHFLGKGIDDGNIVIQNTIALDKNDSEFVLMTKPIILGTKLMIETVKDFNNNLAVNVKLKNKGNLYQIKDFNPKAIIKVKNLVASGKLKQTIELETGNQNKHQHF